MILTNFIGFLLKTERLNRPMPALVQVVAAALASAVPDAVRVALSVLVVRFLDDYPTELVRLENAQ